MKAKPNKGVIVDVVTINGQQPSAEKLRELQEYIDREYYGGHSPSSKALKASLAREPRSRAYWAKKALENARGRLSYDRGSLTPQEQRTPAHTDPHACKTK